MRSVILLEQVVGLFAELDPEDAVEICVLNVGIMRQALASVVLP